MKKPKNDPCIVDITAGEVVYDLDWNSRKEGLTPLTEEQDAARKLLVERAMSGEDVDLDPDAGLEVNMRQRFAEGLSPNHTAVKVRQQPDGSFRLVSGYRRLMCALRIGHDTPILAVDEGDEGKKGPIDVQDRLDNLSENLQRKNLRPWEIAEACAAIHDLHGLSGPQIAKSIGKSKAYVNNLLRLRQKLSADMWESFKAAGETMSTTDLLAVAVVPKKEQADAYNKLREEKRGGRPLGRSSGEAPPEAGSMAEPKHLRNWLKRVISQQSKDPDSEWLAGARHVLEAALGTCVFSPQNEEG